MTSRPSLKSQAASFARLVARLRITDVRTDFAKGVYLIANDNRCVTAFSMSAAVKAWKRGGP